MQTKLGSIAKLFYTFFLFALYVSVTILDDMQAFMITLVGRDSTLGIYFHSGFSNSLGCSDKV